MLQFSDLMVGRGAIEFVNSFTVQFYLHQSADKSNDYYLGYLDEILDLKKAWTVSKINKEADQAPVKKRFAIRTMNQNAKSSEKQLIPLGLQQKEVKSQEAETKEGSAPQSEEQLGDQAARLKKEPQ